MELELNRFKGSLIGLAVGDALGTTVEFSTPGSFRPVKDMVGGGVFQLEAGKWTDDTSMALFWQLVYIGKGHCYPKCMVIVLNHFLLHKYDIEESGSYEFEVRAILSIEAIAKRARARNSGVTIRDHAIL